MTRTREELLMPDCMPKSIFFWGERDYVQGTHQMYAVAGEAIRLGINDVQAISATFTSPLRGPCRIVKGKAPESGWCTKVGISSSDVEHVFYVQQVDGAPLPRVADDESHLISSVSVDVERQIAEGEVSDPSRMLTCLTTLNKRLLEYLLPNEGFGIWVLAKMKICWPIEAARVSLYLERSVGNVMTSSSVLVDGEQIGEIRFVRESLS